MARERYLAVFRGVRLGYCLRDVAERKWTVCYPSTRDGRTAAEEEARRLNRSQPPPPDGPTSPKPLAETTLFSSSTPVEP